MPPLCAWPGLPRLQVALGEERSGELSSLVNAFIMRRTNKLLSAHLPPKVVQVVCCRLTPLQHALYCGFLESKAARRLLSGALRCAALDGSSQMGPGCTPTLSV